MKGKPKGRTLPQKPMLTNEIAWQLKALMNHLPVSVALSPRTKKAVKYISDLSEWRTDEAIIERLREKTDKIQEIKRSKKLAVS
jgi:hypothetical protein